MELSSKSKKYAQKMAICSIVEIHSKLEVIEQILIEENELDKIKNEK